MVGPGHRLVERQVLLDDRRAATDRRQRDLQAERVIGEADGEPEALAQRVHRAQIHLARRRRIGAQAVQQRDGRRARRADGGHRVGDLGERAHAGGHDHRPPLGGHVPQEREIRDLAGRDLEDRHVEALERVGARLIERR